MEYCVLLGTLITTLVLAQAKGPPVILPQYKAKKYSMEGASVHLDCPVVGDPSDPDPTLIIQWSTGNEQIHGGWERFRMKGNSLRIKNIQREDAANYTCRATNGFGSRKVNVRLIVIAKRNITNFQYGGVSHFSVGDKSIKQKGGSLPVFVQPIKMQKKNYQRPVGSSIHFKCRAHANPSPSIVWYKNGREMTFKGKRSHTHWTLKLNNVRKDDSGRYMCKVTNQYGYINYTYTLAVIDKVKHKPILVPPHPINTTVQFGTMASFQCKVRSDVQPHIQWLKRVDDPSKLKNLNSTIDVKGQKFIVLKSSKVWPRMDGSYINKLVLKRATLKDEGLYICLGANTMGYSYKSAYLTVVPPRNRVIARKKFPRLPTSSDEIEKALSDKSVAKKEDGSSHSLLMIIAIPAAVIVVLVIIAIYILQKKKKCNNPPEVCTLKKNKTMHSEKQKFVPLSQQAHRTQMHITENALCDHYVDNVCADEDDTMSTRPSVHSVNTAPSSINTYTTSRASRCDPYNTMCSDRSQSTVNRNSSQYMSDMCQSWDMLAGYSDITSVSQAHRHQHFNHYDC